MITLDSQSAQAATSLGMSSTEGPAQSGPVQRAVNPNSVGASEEALKDRTVVENVAKSVPSLSSPSSGFGFVGSLGSQAAALIVEMGASMRKDNQERSSAQFAEAINNIKQQVDGMMNQSKLGLGMSIASGVFGMAMGVGFSAGGVKDLTSGTGGMAQQAVQANKLTIGKEILQAIVSTMDGAKESQLTAQGANIKSDQAEQTQAEQAADSMSKFSENLKQLIDQALATAREMVSSSNAATQRILA